MTQNNEKQQRIDAQIAEFLANGYKREELIVTQEGTVLYDPSVAEAQVFEGFGKKQSND